MKTGLPYRVYPLDHTAGELEGEAYGKLSCFHQAPVIDDESFVVAETGAIAVYLASKAGKLIADDVKGRARVVHWCFAAMSTFYPTFMTIDMIGVFDKDNAARKLHEEMNKIAGRWMRGLEQHLEGRTWVACSDFTVADVLMAGVLRMCARRT